MKRLLFLLIFISATVFSQKKTINNYKYVIVPKKFDFVKTPDKYQTSSLTKFLLKKKGFTVFLSDEVFPQDLSKNRCLALIADVKDKSNMFITKNIIELKDCNDNVVFASKEGKSRIKQYKRAYHEAIRSAFTSIQKVNYKYIPLASEEVAKTETSTEEVRSEKIIQLQQVKKVEVKISSDILYAQPKKNGFQLVNTQPKVVYELLNTNVKNVYIISNKNGILYKNNNSWIAEYYENGVKLVKNYQIKF